MKLIEMDEFKSLVSEGYAIIDTRIPEAFSDGFFKGSVSISFDENFISSFQELIESDQKSLLIADEEVMPLISKQTTAAGIQNVVGFQFNRWAGGGIGMGLNSYYFLYGASNVLSVFGEYRGYLSKRNTSEYWTFAAGFGQPLKNKTENLTNLKGGFMIQPTIGWRFGASRRYNFFADLGFRLQQVQYESNNTWSENHYKVTYRRWILRGGILF